MYIKESDNFLHRVRQALQLPIRTRCAQLTVLFDRGSIIELQSFFPLLIDSIFGPQCGLSWGLRTTPETCPDDFHQLQHFLSPCGPLFKLIYTLLKDPCAKYDFPLAYLPTKIRQALQSSQIHPFYADLVNIHPQTKQVVSLLLNPFDYYMFNFAYHLINPQHQRGSGCTNLSWNTVYYALSCDYIVHFLPTEPGAQVLPLISYYNGKNPLQSMQEIRRPPLTSKLISAEFLNKTLEDYKFHQNLDKHPRNEIWRSETVLTVFIDMWFNNDQISQPTNQMNSFNVSQINLLKYNELPTGEYMRIVRALIKQTHAFSISGKADDTHLGELKKIALPMLHGKFYIFLRNLIHRWPLDGSFRLVLELWLTYIQPWRYTPDNLVKTKIKNMFNADADDINVGQTKSIEREYLPFIAENLLTYVIIFQQLLPRFCRVDLVSPKMAVMLYRITKVFAQPNLTAYLREVEQCVENNHSPSHSYNSQWCSNLPPLSPTTNWSTNTLYDSPDKSALSPNMKNSFFTGGLQTERKWSALIRQKIYELEGPNFYYKPLFSFPPAPEVYDLLLLIKKSLKIAQELVQSKQEEITEKYSGFFGSLKSLFESPSPSPNDEFTLNDRLKVPIYLEHSLQNLMEIFQITEIHEKEADTSNSSASSGGMDLSEDMNFLTPKRVRERVKKIKYEGDPDLLPVQSNEVIFLVRAFYQLSSKINEEFGPIFRKYYYQDTYFGRLHRQILQPSVTIYTFDKTKLGSPRVSSHLPPRISLRYFASYRFIKYFIAGALVFTFCFGYSMATYIFTLVFIYILYICLKAIPKNSVSHSYPTGGFGNISFNDSF